MTSSGRCRCQSITIDADPQEVLVSRQPLAVSIALIGLSLSLNPAVMAQPSRQPAPPPATALGAKAPEALHFGKWGVDLSGMDRQVNPADDFDRYVNGAWIDKTEIPADQGSAGVGYDVFNLSQQQIRA